MVFGRVTALSVVLKKKYDWRKKKIFEKHYLEIMLNKKRLNSRN